MNGIAEWNIFLVSFFWGFLLGSNVGWGDENGFVYRSRWLNRIRFWRSICTVSSTTLTGAPPTLPSPVSFRDYCFLLETGVMSFYSLVWTMIKYWYYDVCVLYCTVYFIINDYFLCLLVLLGYVVLFVSWFCFTFIYPCAHLARRKKGYPQPPHQQPISFPLKCKRNTTQP